MVDKLIPGIQWIQQYKKKNLSGDLSGGLTVGVMLIPQGMAYAMIAGLPPIYGLYASTIPILVYALFGSSYQLAVGPVAMVSLLVAAGIASLGVSDPAQYIELAILLALFVGLIQFLMGLFRLGFIVNFLSHPVISGFTSAAALIIGFSQLKHLLGVSLPRSHHVHEIIFNAIEKYQEINLYAVGIGILGIFIIILSKKIHKRIPGSLLAVVLGISVVYFLDLADSGVKIVGDVPTGLPSFGIPVFSWAVFEKLLPIALAIALVSFMESIAVAKAIQAKHKDYEINANQELKGLGLANIIGSFFQSFPVTGGFSRTAVNDQSGAKTPLASFVSVLIIVLTLLFLTSWFYHLPNAILASVILVAVFGLIDFREARFLWKTNKTDFTMLLVTFLSTLALGIEQGILIGVVLSLAMVIFRSSRPHIAILGKVPGTSLYRKLDRFPHLEMREDILIFRFDASLYFANVNYFLDNLKEAIETKGSQTSLIIINGESINDIDSTGIHCLSDLSKDLVAKGVELYFAGLKGPVRDAMKVSGLTESIGENNFHMSIQAAVDHYDKIVFKTGKNGAKGYVLQTNS
jgi:SulP family sulfate permease